MFLYVFIFSQKEMINHRLTKITIERSPQSIWICYRTEQMHKYVDFIENQDSDHVRNKIQIQKNKNLVVFVEFDLVLEFFKCMCFLKSS